MSSLWVVGIALRSLAAHRLRTVLTMLGIIIGVACVIAMISMGRGAATALKDDFQRLGANLIFVRPGAARQGHVQTGQVQTLRLEDAEAVAAEVPGVVDVAPESSVMKQVKYLEKNVPAVIFGTTPNYADMRNCGVKAGRWHTPQESRLRAKVCLLGARVATELFGAGTPIGVMVKLGGVNFEVIGVLEAKGDTWSSPDERVFVPLETAMDAITGEDFIRGMTVKCASEERMPEIQAAIEELVKRRHRIPAEEDPDIQVWSQQEFLEGMRRMMESVTALLTGVAAVSLIVGGIGIMNIMLVSVTERTREIGIRKALGATRGDILRQFLVEAVVISAIGGALGVGLGGGGYYILARNIGWQFVLPGHALALALGTAAAIGIFFGIVPAAKAARLDPIEALRYE